MLQASSPDVFRMPDMCYRKACMCTDALFGVAGCLHLESQNTSSWVGHPIGGPGGREGGAVTHKAASSKPKVFS